MRYTTWLQNRSPARALDRKTPYEMVKNKKPHLGGIQEFGVAAYMKDLKAGKLDACVQLGRFVGYDTESKGYRIYWPAKRSVTIECNVVFKKKKKNEKDIHTSDGTITLSGGVQSEGEREKIIHYPENTEENLEKNPVSGEQPENKGSEDEQNMSNTIPFPSVPEPNVEPEIPGDENTQQYG